MCMEVFSAAYYKHLFGHTAPTDMVQPNASMINENSRYRASGCCRRAFAERGLFSGFAVVHAWFEVVA